MMRIIKAARAERADPMNEEEDVFGWGGSLDEHSESHGQEEVRYAKEVSKSPENGKGNVNNLKKTKRSKKKGKDTIKIMYANITEMSKKAKLHLLNDESEILIAAETHVKRERALSGRGRREVPIPKGKDVDHVCIPIMDLHIYIS